MIRASRYGHGLLSAPKTKAASVLSRARSVGIAGDVESLQLALAAMIGGYDRLLATTPAASHVVIKGAFGKSPDVARQILDAV